MYTLHFPCNECAKLIISSGIKEVVYLKMYREQVPKAEMMFQQSGVQVRRLETNFTDKIELMQEVISSTRE